MPGPQNRPSPRASQNRPGGGNRPAQNRPSQNRPGGSGSAPRGAAGMNARRDVTEANVTANYFKRTNFDETRNRYTMVKITFISLAVILAFGALAWFLNLGTNFLIIDGILLLLWFIYFVNGIRMKHKFRSMPIKDRGNYWTYELSQEYKDANVKMNDFKRALAQSSLIDDTTLIDDVRVEMLSIDPLVFEFSIRSSKSSSEKNVITTVESWSGKFEAREGHAERLDNITYRVTYPMKGQWQVLDGKTVTPSMALKRAGDGNIGIDCNPFGICTTSMEEVAVVNSSRHLMITGISGYGKSATLNAILKNVMEDPTDVLIVFFDHKEVEANVLKDRCWTVYTVDQAKIWIDALSKEVKRRQHYQTQLNKKKFATPEKAAKDPDATPYNSKFPPILIVVDECGEWLSENVKFATLFTNFLSSISRKGRSSGMALIVASQDAKQATIPSSVRNNIDQQIAFKLPNQAEDEHGMGNFQPNDPRPSEIPIKTDDGGGGCGQCCARTATTNGMVLPVKSYYVTSEELEATAKRTAFRKKRYPVVQYAEKQYNALDSGRPALEMPFQ